MPQFRLPDGAELNYQDQGQGRPLIFIHGVWMSSRFFDNQREFFKDRCRVITLDLRGHGGSSHMHTGHTVANYARDLRAFMEGLGLKDVVLAGWSMGSFVIWDYFDQFGAQDVKAVVFVEETPSDYKWPDWDLGFADFEVLKSIMADMQDPKAREAFILEFIGEMFKEPPAQADVDWMLAEISRPPATIAASIIFDQTVQDYRPVIPKVNVPALLIFGRDEKLIPLAGADYLMQNLPDARLEIMENSGHCPFLEEPELFNQKIAQFLEDIG